MPELLLDGVEFPEGPRWHDGDFYFSHFTDQTLYRVTADGQREPVVVLGGDTPSASGWLPDGTTIVTSSRTKQLLKLVDGETAVHADISTFAGDFLNDMTVDGDGNSYVGTRTAAMRPSKQPLGSEWEVDTIVLVAPDGTARVAAEGLVAPNGTVIAPDGSYLVVAETYAARITRFDRAPDGTLSNRRVFADVPGTYPDGTCLDDEGAVWFGSPYTSEFIRVREGGEITDRHVLPGSVACTLGGADRRTLFLLGVNPDSLPEPDSTAPFERSQPTFSGGHIWTMRVEHAGAGWP